MKNVHVKNKDSGDSPGGPVVKTVLPTERCRGWFLVEKLRSNVPGRHSRKKKKNQDSTPPFLGRLCWYSFDDKTSFPGQGCTDSLSWCWCGLFHFSWDLERMYPWLIWCSLFWQDIKLCWTSCFFGAVPQGYLRGCLLGYTLQFGSNKTLFFSYCRSCVDYFHHQ